MSMHRILFQAAATAALNVDLSDGVTDPTGVQEAAEEQGVEFPTLCNGCESHVDLSDEWMPVAVDGELFPGPDDAQVVDALNDTIERFFAEVDIETFKFDDLAHLLLQSLKRAGHFT